MKLVWDRHLDHFVVIVNGQDVYPVQAIGTLST